MKFTYSFTVCDTQRIVTFATSNCILVSENAASHVDGVVTRTTVDTICTARGAIDGVIAAITGQNVVTRTTGNRVAAFAALDIQNNRCTKNTATVNRQGLIIVTHDVVGDRTGIQSGGVDG